MPAVSLRGNFPDFFAASQLVYSSSVSFPTYDYFKRCRIRKFKKMSRLQTTILLGHVMMFNQFVSREKSFFDLLFSQTRNVEVFFSCVSLQITHSHERSYHYLFRVKQIFQIVSLLDNEPNHLVLCIIQKRYVTNQNHPIPTQHPPSDSTLLKMHIIYLLVIWSIGFILLLLFNHKSNIFSEGFQPPSNLTSLKPPNQNARGRLSHV